MAEGCESKETRRGVLKEGERQEERGDGGDG